MCLAADVVCELEFNYMRDRKGNIYIKINKRKYLFKRKIFAYIYKYIGHYI